MTAPLSLRLYSTLTRGVEALTPAEPGHVRVYCCGPTPYDEAHVGHARSGLLGDLLVRHLRAGGVKVTYVRNVTDVDDKILERAKQAGEEPLALSARFAARYQDDLAAVGCLPPTHEPRVSECIGDIVDFVRGLVERGAAYEVETPAGRDVWYSVRSFEGYGKLSRRPIDELRSGQGLEARGKAARRDKRDPLDFALWKAAPEGEWAFDSPWGRGRPGWHIECSAMCERYLGFGFDVHLGGMDLVFPHHENEIAQSEAMHPGEGPFAHVWMHGGFVNVRKPKPPAEGEASAAPAGAASAVPPPAPPPAGAEPASAAPSGAEAEVEKMSKSLGNFFTVRECLRRNDPEALRYFLLSAHYRVPLLFDIEPLPGGGASFPGLDEAERRVDSLYATAERLAALAAGAPGGAGGPGGGAGEAGGPGGGAAGPGRELAPIAEAVRGAPGRVRAAFDDDLNAPAALAALSELARAAGQLCELAPRRRKDAALQAAAAALAGEALAALGACTGALGLMRAAPAEYAARTRERRLLARGLSAAEIDAKVLERERARQARDFARGDALRAELAARGVELSDGPEGTSWRVSA